jgi:hypothetical protein
VKQSEMSNIPDLATEILSKLEQKKETAAAHLGISAAEVETMPFDLTALEQAGPPVASISKTRRNVQRSSSKRKIIRSPARWLKRKIGTLP